MEEQYIITLDNLYKARIRGAKDIRKRKRRLFGYKGEEVGHLKETSFGKKRRLAEEMEEKPSGQKMLRSLNIIQDIQEEVIEKARVKGFLRTRKGKLERVKEFERKGEKKREEERKPKYVSYEEATAGGKLFSVFARSMEDSRETSNYLVRANSLVEAKEKVRKHFSLVKPTEGYRIKKEDFLGYDLSKKDLKKIDKKKVHLYEYGT